jgi:hypothetical protein
MNRHSSTLFCLFTGSQFPLLRNLILSKVPYVTSSPGKDNRFGSGHETKNWYLGVAKEVRSFNVEKSGRFVDRSG